MMLYFIGQQDRITHSSTDMGWNPSRP